MTARLLILCVALAGGLVAADAPSGPRPATTAGMHNVRQLTARVLIGSSPDGLDGFASLRRLGVRTVLSVDGAPPEVELAARQGLRYVHLPVGYDGVPPAQLARIAKALRDLPGPVYVHCHHGKHRGPAAATSALVCLGEMTPDDAVRAMRDAGTDPRYAGLIALPHTLTPLSAADLDRVPSDFPAQAPTADLTQLMVRLDATWDRLKSRPDAPAALQLQEHYREARRLPEVARRGAEFAALLAEAEAAAGRVEASPTPREAAASQRLCTQCHAQFRD